MQLSIKIKKELLKNKSKLFCQKNHSMAGNIDQIQDPKTNFALATVYTGSYDYIPCTALSTLPTSITTGGGETETWQLPSNIVCNLSDLEYRIQLTGVAAASTAHFIYSNQFPLRRLQITHEGLTLCDISDAATISNLVSFSALNKKKLKTFDKAYGANGTAVGLHQFARSGISTDYYDQLISASSATTTYTAWRTNQTTDFMGVLGTGATDPTATAGSNIAFPTEIGPDYPTEFYNPTSVNTSSPQILVRIKLSDAFKGTVLNIKKDIWLPGTLVITFTWEGTTQWVMESDATSVWSAVSAATQSVTVGSQQMLVPVQRDANIIDEIKNSTGVKYVFDTPLTKTLTLTGTSQIPVQQLTKGVFARIKMQIFAVYNATRSGSTAFNHRMDEAATQNRKIRSFYTQVNDKRVQSTLVDLANLDDWAMQREAFEDSVIGLSFNTYRKYWIWPELYGLPNFVESIESDEFQGYDSTSNDYSYSVQATTTNRTNLWIMVIIGQRILAYDDEKNLIIITSA